MGNCAQYMEEDKCIFKEFCIKDNKAWCKDFKILKESNCTCTIFEKILQKSNTYLIEKRGWKILQ